MRAIDSSGLEVLSEAECLRLLEAGGVGHLAFVEDQRPVLRPVNFALDVGRIVLRTGEGSIRRAARQGLPATFEVDQPHNIDHTAWSVIVDGTLSLAPRGGAEHLPLRPWAPAGKDHFVQISIEAITGRSIGAL